MKHGHSADCCVPPFPLYLTLTDCVSTNIHESINCPNKQERVVKDTEQMIPRTRQSLQDAVLALEDLVVSPADVSITTLMGD